MNAEARRQMIENAAAAFTQRENDPRYFIESDHDGAITATRIVGAIGAHYRHHLGAQDWSYQAAAEVLQDIAESVAYNPEYLAESVDDIWEIAERLADIYTADQHQWFCEHYAVFCEHEAELRYEGILESAYTVAQIIQHAQHAAYETAARIALEILREIEQEHDDADEEAELQRKERR